MILLDANILIYSWNSGDKRHPAARSWLKSAFDQDLIGIPWLSIWAFLRLTTNPKLFPKPLEINQAEQVVRRWLDSSTVLVVQPGEKHLDVLTRLVQQGQAHGRLLSDAVLAAIAIENNATLASTDRDFARFPGLKWVNPLP